MHPLAPILLSDPRAIAAANDDCLVIGSGTSGVTTAIEPARQRPQGREHEAAC